MFKKGFEKVASHGWELAGLGMLAAPSAYHLATGKDVGEKKKSAVEVAGLGTLAVPSLKAVLKKKAASELEMGKKVEKEHTKTVDEVIERTKKGEPKEKVKEEAVKDTAKDHLEEDKKYYSKLKKMEEGFKKVVH